MSDEEKPRLHVVAENSQSKIDAELAQQVIDQALRELASNIMRVVRGAGRPEELIGQCADVVNAAVAFDEKTGRWSSPYAISSALRLEHEFEGIDDEDTFWAVRKRAMRRIVRGALQAAASKLLDQPLHIDKGEKEMDEAIRRIEEARDEIRKKRAAEAKASRPLASTKAKRGPKSAPKRSPPKS